MARFFAALVHHEIARDAAQPFAEVLIIIEMLAPPVRNNEDLLGDIVHPVSFHAQRANKRAQSTLVFPDEVREFVQTEWIGLRHCYSPDFEARCYHPILSSHGQV